MKRMGCKTIMYGTMIDSIQQLYETVDSIQYDPNLSTEQKDKLISQIYIKYTKRIYTQLNSDIPMSNQQLTQEEISILSTTYGTQTNVLAALLANPAKARAVIAKYNLQAPASVDDDLPPPPSGAVTTQTAKPKGTFPTRIYRNKQGNISLNLKELNMGYGQGWMKPLLDGRQGMGVAKGAVAVDLKLVGRNLVVSSTFTNLNDAEIAFLRSIGTVDISNSDTPVQPSNSTQESIVPGSSEKTVQKEKEYWKEAIALQKALPEIYNTVEAAHQSILTALVKKIKKDTEQKPSDRIANLSPP